MPTTQDALACFETAHRTFKLKQLLQQGDQVLTLIRIVQVQFLVCQERIIPDASLEDTDAVGRTCRSQTRRICEEGKTQGAKNMAN